MKYKIKLNLIVRHYYFNNKLHREDGPAVEWGNGTKFWYRNGKFHREGGPACEYIDGTKFWYLNGEELTKAEFNALKV